MKKCLSSILALALTFSLVGCSADLEARPAPLAVLLVIPLIPRFP